MSEHNQPETAAIRHKLCACMCVRVGGRFLYAHLLKSKMRISLAKVGNFGRGHFSWSSPFQRIIKRLER